MLQTLYHSSTTIHPCYRYALDSEIYFVSGSTICMSLCSSAPLLLLLYESPSDQNLTVGCIFLQRHEKTNLYMLSSLANIYKFAFQAYAGQPRLTAWKGCQNLMYAPWILPFVHSWR
jgi:hypothetical protein